MSSQNLGQVSGLWVGTSAPTNTTLIWYDDTPAIRCHKVYSVTAAAWVVLDQNVISAITYSELKNLAQSTGLTQGSWYKITDQGNILALAITSTKVQYVDVNNNFVIDDLAASATYVITSSNLLIDDISGVWDATNKRLKFSFAETAHDGNTDNDFIFGKRQRGGVWSLAKYKLSALISAVTGNSVTWNKGIFFNFNSAFNSKIDVAGGVVGKNTYDSEKATMNQNIINVAASNQAILNTAKNYTDSKTTSSEIYGKTLPSAPTLGTAIDIAQGDTLSGIITKIYRWINKFKMADGIVITPSFTPSADYTSINNNDTVDSAFRKVQFYINKILQQSKGLLVNSEYIKQQHTITPGVSTINDWMENFDFLKDYNQKFDYIISANDTDVSYPISKLGTLSSVVTSSGIKSVLIKRGEYNYVPSDDGAGIDVSFIINNGIRIFFEPGVNINVNNNPLQTTGSMYLFQASDISGNHQKINCYFIGNGCTIRNLSESIRLESFYKCINVNDFKLFGKNRLTLCYFVSNVIFDDETITSFLECARLNKCYGGFSNCSYIKECYVTITSGVFNAYCLSCSAPSDNNMFSDNGITQINSSSTGGFNSIRS